MVGHTVYTNRVGKVVRVESRGGVVLELFVPCTADMYVPVTVYGIGWCSCCVYEQLVCMSNWYK